MIGDAIATGAAVDAAMRPPAASALLDAWDAGRHATPARRALLLLSLEGPAASADAMARLTVGQQNERLLRFRARTFGDRLDCLVECPACGDALELTVHASELLAGVDTHHDARQDGALPELWIDTPAGELRFHPPTVGDILAAVDGAAAGGGGNAAPAALLAHCIDSPAATPLAFTPELEEEVAQRMLQADPLADVELALACPTCAHAWTAPLDVPTWIWTELDAWALRTLAHVHRLAAAYGWTEAEVLSLSPSRREAYLEMLQS
jgi:hypothetical protein